MSFARCARWLTPLWVVLAFSALAEERTISLANPVGPSDLQELTTLVRIVSEVSKMKASDGVTFQMQGRGELVMAEWILRRLDRPVTWRPSEQERGNPSTRTWQNRLRIFCLPEDTSPQRIQETLSAIRAALDIQRVAHFTRQHAILARGTPTELETIEWLVNNLGAETVSLPYKVEDARGFTVLQVFPLDPSIPVKQVIDVMKDMRKDIRTPKVFIVTSPPRLIVRASAADLERTAAVVGNY